MKLTLHYNGDGQHTISLRARVQAINGLGRRVVILTKRQRARVERSKIGSGPDGTVGPVTYSVDGQRVTLVSAPA